MRRKQLEQRILLEQTAHVARVCHKMTPKTKDESCANGDISSHFVENERARKRCGTKKMARFRMQRQQCETIRNASSSLLQNCAHATLITPDVRRPNAFEWLMAFGDRVAVAEIEMKTIVFGSTAILEVTAGRGDSAVEICAKNNIRAVRR